MDAGAQKSQPGGRLVAAPTVGMGGPAGRRGRCPHRPAPAAGGSHGRRCAEIAAKRARDARPYGGIAAPIRSAKAYWRCWFVCLRRGTFRAVRSSQNAPGAAAPGPPLGPAACIPRSGISWAAKLHRAVPFHTACPFPASRGPVESEGRYGYRTFLKGRTYCPRTKAKSCTRQLLRINVAFPTVGAAISRPPCCVVGTPAANAPGCIFAVGARNARPCRASGLSRRAR